MSINQFKLDNVIQPPKGKSAEELLQEESIKSGDSLQNDCKWQEAIKAYQVAGAEGQEKLIKLAETCNERGLTSIAVEACQSAGAEGQKKLVEFGNDFCKNYDFSKAISCYEAAGEKGLEGLQKAKAKITK